MCNQHPRIDRLPIIGTHHVDVLRLDLLHPVTGGNKHFKLSHNIRAAVRKRSAIVTFGGAHSNHIAATAVCCAEAGVMSYGIIRAHGSMQTPTLDLARSCGMKLIFAGRNDYMNPGRLLTTLREKIGEIHVVPAGGCNREGITGCGDILPQRHGYNYVFLACGSGTTMAGMLAAEKGDTTYIGISPLKGLNRLPADVASFVAETGKAVEVLGDDLLDNESITRHCVLSAYAGKGFGRYDEDMALYRQKFVDQTGIDLDHVYLPKLFFAADDLCTRGRIPLGSRMLVVHSGGLQGNAAFERRYLKRLALIAG